MANNVTSISALNATNRASRSAADSSSRVASGLRVVKAADDAAGLGESTIMETIASSTVAGIRNANDGISVVHTAAGAASQVTDILQRMRILAVESASGTLDDGARTQIQAEYAELGNEMSRIAESTEFNGTKVSKGTIEAIAAQVAGVTNEDGEVSIPMTDLAAESLGVDGDISTVGGAREALGAIDEAIGTLGSYQAELGASHERLLSAVESGETLAVNMTDAASRITDADMALEVSQNVQHLLQEQAGIASMAQANNMNMSMMSLLA